jgi:hypothetical protein
LGVTPSAWRSTFRALQILGTATLSSNSNTTVYLGSNWYNNSSNQDVYTVTGAAGIYAISAGVHAWYNAPSGTAGSVATFTQAMTLDASGNLLVGATSSAGEKFRVIQTATSVVAYWTNSNATPNGLYMNYSAASPNNTGSNFIQVGDSSANRFIVNSNGGIQNYSANNVNLSDQREKKNIELAGNYLDKICAIPIKTFLFNDQTDTDKNLGAIAQDVQAVAPELVMESNWGTEEEPKMRLSIYQTDLQYALMKCIQEQQALITTLTARITALESA